MWVHIGKIRSEAQECKRKRRLQANTDQIIRNQKNFWIQPVQLGFSSVRLLSRVWLCATPWIAGRQVSLSITNSRSSLRLTSIESVTPSSHLILCRPLLLLPPIPPSIRVFSNESTLHMRWGNKSRLNKREIGNHTGQKTKVKSLKHWTFTEEVLLASLGLFFLLSISSNRSLPGVETYTGVASDPSSVQLNPSSAQPEVHCRSGNFVKFKSIIGGKEGTLWP